ncbi:MAG: sigma-70 family RNA polymerase sigma factor [Ilumatobacteraceae bacterium]|nr:sigma-70 family RNA polymerase sigma factor [Ilumatobacteraceae bacterium]
MTSTTTDAQLVTDHLAGDRAAFAAIYDRYGATLYDTAAAMTRHRDDAADITQDVFVVAAERMSQLRDPSRLKPWLFAILRNEVYRRSGRRKRVVLTDFTEPTAEMALPPQTDDESAGLEYQELAELVRNAAVGLDERDQLVLELSVRQGLEGDDLADALGVTTQQSYGLVHRMRQRTERSLGAYCVASGGRDDCDELASILSGWDGEFTVLIRKRVARHIDRCEICERSRRKVAPLALFGAAPAFAAPADLRDRVLAAAGSGVEPSYGFGAPGGFPAALRQARRLGLWITLSTLALLFVGGTTAWVLANGDAELAIGDGTTTTTSPIDDASTTLAAPVTAVDSVAPTTTDGSTTTTASSSTSTTSSSTTSTTSTTTGTSTTSTVPVVVTLPPATIPPPTTTTTTTTTNPPATTTTVAPGALTLSAGSIDFGATRDSATITLGNTGGSPVDWSSLTGPSGFRGVASPFSASPSDGTLAPGAQLDVVVTIDRTWSVEGPLTTQRLTFVGPGTSAAVDLDGVIARPPVVEVRRPGATHCPIVVGAGDNPLVATAVITDESPPITALWRITGPNGGRVANLTQRRADWFASVDLDFDGQQGPDTGLFTWTITATDGFGNRTVVSGETDVQTAYCG